ncbi:Flp family type IVb pilin [Celeribacter sp.]|uniref:Flp family type IVb pilin n=1 Tax=Celeribacter sp. TaxID=1890673 RepID=UPI003A939397
MKFFKLMNRFNREEDGATAIEYGLFAALIAAAIVVTVGKLGKTVDSNFDTVNTAITITP